MCNKNLFFLLNVIGHASMTFLALYVQKHPKNWPLLYNKYYRVATTAKWSKALNSESHEPRSIPVFVLVVGFIGTPHAEKFTH